MDDIFLFLSIADVMVIIMAMILVWWLSKEYYREKYESKLWDAKLEGMGYVINAWKQVLNQAEKLEQEKKEEKV